MSNGLDESEEQSWAGRAVAWQSSCCDMVQEHQTPISPFKPREIKFELRLMDATNHLWVDIGNPYGPVGPDR
jgi:hypothetical protein